jgi:hypothetical protein
VAPNDPVLLLTKTYTATFTVRNVGTLATSGLWADVLFLSQDQTVWT